MVKYYFIFGNILQKYESCIDTTNKDRDYICLLAAYISLQLAQDKNVENYFISVFNKKWQSFGDIVIEIIKADLTNVIYAIKCKPISESKSKLTSLNSLIKMDKEICRAMDLKNIPDFDKVTFAIFTNAQMTNKSATKVKSTSDIENKTIKKEQIILINKKDHNLLKVSEKDDALFKISSPASPHIILFSSQKADTESLKKLLSRYFEDHPNILSVSQEFIKYIKHWSTGELGGEYSLNKTDIILKIVYILLKDVIVEPIILSKNSGTTLESYKIWNSVIEKVDLTVIQNEPYNISRISDVLVRIVENTFNTTVRPNGSLSLNEDIVQRVDPEVKAYLFELVHNLKGPISIAKIYYALWKANRIPLLINDKEKWCDFILEVIDFLKQHGFKRSFIIFSNDPSSLSSRKNLIIFKTLDDIKEHVMLNQIYLEVLNGPEVTLENIFDSNPFALKWVTPQLFLNLSSKKCLFKGFTHKNISEQEDCRYIVLNDNSILQHIYEGVHQNTDDNKFIDFGKLKGLNPTLLSTNTLKFNKNLVGQK